MIFCLLFWTKLAQTSILWLITTRCLREVPELPHLYLPLHTVTAMQRNIIIIVMNIIHRILITKTSAVPPDKPLAYFSVKITPTFLVILISLFIPNTVANYALDYLFAAILASYSSKIYNIILGKRKGITNLD